MINNNSVRKILILAANPKSTSPLRLDQELREISEGLQRSQQRSEFELKQRLAVRPRDIQRAMLDISPQIVHFSGHGAGNEGLVFENEIGQAKFVDGEALAELFELFADQVECVVLNGCYSLVQAEAISRHIRYVIGMSQAIGDRAAIAFAVGFYDALGAGRSIEFAYRVGCNAIRIEGIDEYLTPNLIKKSDNTNIFDQTQNSQSANEPNQLSTAINQQNSSTPTADARVISSLAHEKFHIQARNRLLKRMTTEVEGLLKSRLCGAIPLNLLLEERSELVEPAYASTVKMRGNSNPAISPTTKLIEIFDRKDVSGKLLIVGTPGSGKTTAQLILVQELIQRAISDISSPIPVILNLASWQGDKQALNDWIVSELKSKHRVHERISRDWLSHEQLLPCLDGLDEMESSNQRRCIHFINQFQRYDSPHHLIVCSRLEEYKKCNLPLELNTAVYIHPLVENEIHNYLISANRMDLFASLQTNRRLLDLVKTPLFLFLLVLACESNTASSWFSGDSYQESYTSLFSQYVDKSLKRNYKSYWYRRQPDSINTKRWLTWLAIKLEGYSQTEFLIERMQPSWLDTKAQKRSYYFIVCSSISLVTLPIWISIGLLINFILLRDYSKETAICGGIFTSSLLGITIGLLIQEIQPIETLKFPGRDFLDELRFAGWVDRLLSFGFLAHFQGLTNIKQNVNRQIDSLPFSNYIKAILYPFVDPLSYLLRGLIGLVVPIGGFIRGLFLGFRGSSVGVEKKVSPNQAIKISALNSIKYALIFSLIGVMLGALFGWASPAIEARLIDLIQSSSEQIQPIEENQTSGLFQDNQTQNRKSPQISREEKEKQIGEIRKRQDRTLRYLPFVFGLVGFMLGGLIPGLACIQHFALRIVLFVSGSAPLRYARFLNYATERLLLQRIGGRYQFIHELLRKHFANS